MKQELMEYSSPCGGAIATRSRSHNLNIHDPQFLHCVIRPIRDQEILDEEEWTSRL